MLFRPLWISIVLLAFVWAVQTDVSVQYADCPKDCKCSKMAMASILSCRRLITETVADLPISKFELIQTDTPITLGENAFLNMGLTHVNVISIVNATIESIDKNAFNGLKDLTHIRITHSKISQLQPDTFKNIPKLKKLNLVGNPLSKDTVIASETLEELKLAHCGLNEISGKLFEQAPMLTLLELTGNGIEQLSANVFDSLLNIEELNLSHNKLKELPKELFLKNEVLDILDLSYNPLTSFSSDSVSNLELLKLKSCLLTEIDGNMFRNMHYLYNLDLSNNKIANIDPNAFVNMTEIATIDLSGNDLQSLNENLFVNNVDLQKLYLDNNVQIKLPVHGFKAPKMAFALNHFSCKNCNLKSLSKNTFRNMPGLLTLFLSHNNIEDISNGVFHNLTSLIELDLSHNKITTINDETFKKNTNLNKLNLSHNTLKALHASMFKNNENLKYLEISNCGLYQLWTGESNNIHIPSMVSLNASNNNIDLIKKEDIAITNHLKSLDISNNKIICSEDLRDLIIYLESQNIKNTEFITHEKQSYDFEARENEETSWQQFAKNMCPSLLDEDEERELDEDDDEEYDEDIEDETGDYANEDQLLFTSETYNDILPEEEMVLPYQHHERYKYSFLWPVLIFLGTALTVLGLVANVILYVIRRRQAIPMPRIISVPKMSRLKKNSGLVYQQLSEEHGPKTPILNRFTPVPSVHTSNEQESV